MYDDLRNYLVDKYSDQARRSLVMLKNVHSIELQYKGCGGNSQKSSSSSFLTSIARKHFPKRDSIKTLDGTGPDLRMAKSQSIWKVSSQIAVESLYQEQDDGKQFQQIESYTLTIKTETRNTSESAEWLVSKAFIRDISVLPSDLRKFAIEERLMATNRTDRSVPDIAIAAPLSGERVGSLFYNSLPLDMKCELPANFHARFAISPDRRTIRTDSKGGEWNKFLAEKCLSRIYFIFLERLAMLPVVGYYAFWPPTRSEAHTDETGYIQSAFWDQIRGSSRRIFVDSVQLGLPVGISQTIFDRRTATPSDHPALSSLVKRLQPSHVVVSHSTVLQGIFDPVVEQNNSSVTTLDPELVRRLLQKHSRKVDMAKLTFKDAELRILLKFIMVTGAMNELEGCRILPLDNGKLAKITHSLTICLANRKYRYITDKDGFRLFKDIGQGCIISPAVLSGNESIVLKISPFYSVQHLEGSVIDRLLKVKSFPANIHTFPQPDSKWVTDVYKFVTLRKFSVNSYETLPMVPLTREHTFVSINAWNTLRIMPPIDDPDLLKICDLLPEFYVLADLALQTMAAQVKVTDKERFLECLHRFIDGDGPSLEKSLRKTLTLDQLKVLIISYVLTLVSEGNVCIVLRDTSNSHACSEMRVTTHANLESHRIRLPRYSTGRFNPPRRRLTTRCPSPWSFHPRRISAGAQVHP
jgi:hypothetical protein